MKLISEKTCFVLSGNSVLIVVNQKIFLEERAASVTRQTTPSRQTATSVDESEGLSFRVHAAASHFLFVVAQDRKLSLSGCLGWAEEALKRQVSAEQQRRCSYRGPERILRFFAHLLGSRDCWPIEQAEKIGFAVAMITFEAPPPGYDVLRCVGGGAAIAPFTAR